MVYLEKMDNLAIARYEAKVDDNGIINLDNGLSLRSRELSVLSPLMMEINKILEKPCECNEDLGVFCDNCSDLKTKVDNFVKEKNILKKRRSDFYKQFLENSEKTTFLLKKMSAGMFENVTVIKKFEEISEMLGNEYKYSFKKTDDLEKNLFQKQAKLANKRNELEQIEILKKTSLDLFEKELVNMLETRHLFTFNEEFKTVEEFKTIIKNEILNNLPINLRRYIGGDVFSSFESDLKNWFENYEEIKKNLEINLNYKSEVENNTIEPESAPAPAPAPTPNAIIPLVEIKKKEQVDKKFILSFVNEIDNEDVTNIDKAMVLLSLIKSNSGNITKSLLSTLLSNLQSAVNKQLANDCNFTIESNELFNSVVEYKK